MRLSRYLVLVFLLCPIFAYGQGMQVKDVATKLVNGVYVPAIGASVTVCTSAGSGTPCTPLATIYTDKALTQTSANPIIIGTSSNSDTLGNFNFYVSPSVYVATITGSGLTSRSTAYQVACPTDGNCAFTGSVTTTGCTTINGQVYIGGTGCPATAAGINAAIQSVSGCPSPGTGCTIWLPQGITQISSTIVIDRPVHLRGQNGNYNGRGSMLQWTGGASPLISISGAAGSSTGTSIDDLALDNTGTATVGVDIDNNSVFISLNRVYSVPSVPYSIAGVRIGNTTSGSAVFDVYMNETDFENSPINLLLLRCFHFVGIRTRWVNATVNDVQIGDATHIVQSAHFYGYDIEPANTNNVTEVNILNGADITFTDGFAEQNGASSFWLDCPATATACNGIFVRGGWFQSNSSATTIFHTNLATATLSVESAEGNNFPPASNWIKNDASRRIWMCNIVSDSANLNFLTSNTNASFCPANSGAGLVGPYFNDAATFRGDVLLSSNVSNAQRLQFAEATAPSAEAGRDDCYGDSTAHALECSYNNGSFSVVPLQGRANTLTGINSFPGNTAALTADWTCGTAGTVSSCVAATIIGSGGGVPLTFTLPLAAQSYTLECDGVVGQATAATANQWNLLTATNGATNVTANYSMATAATASAFGAVTDQASTTTTFQIAPKLDARRHGNKDAFPYLRQD
jgi:hypothetical protein